MTSSEPCSVAEWVGALRVHRRQRRGTARQPALLEVFVTQDALSADPGKGLGWVPDDQALTAWGDAERARRGRTGDGDASTADTARDRGHAHASAAGEGGRTLTWAQWDERATRLTHALRDGLGLERGDRVAVLAYDRFERLEIYAGLARAGLVVVSPNVRLLGREIADIVGHGKARAVIVQDELRKHPDTIAGDRRRTRDRATPTRRAGRGSGGLAALRGAARPRVDGAAGGRRRAARDADVPGELAVRRPDLRLPRRDDRRRRSCALRLRGAARDVRARARDVHVARADARRHDA